MLHNVSNQMQRKKEKQKDKSAFHPRSFPLFYRRQYIGQMKSIFIFHTANLLYYSIFISSYRLCLDPSKCTPQKRRAAGLTLTQGSKRAYLYFLSSNAKSICCSTCQFSKDELDSIRHRFL